MSDPRATDRTSRLGRWRVTRVQSPPPRSVQHPGVDGNADNALSLDDAAQHLVAELAFAGDQRAAALVAGQQRPFVAIRCLQRGPIRSVGDVERDPQLAHQVEELVRVVPEAALGPGPRAVGIRADAVVSEAYHAHPERVEEAAQAAEDGAEVPGPRVAQRKGDQPS